MINGFGMKKNVRYSKPQECSICKRMFLTSQDLISHFDTFHSHQHFSTFSSSSAATATAATAAPFRQYPNRNPNPGFPARNYFDLSYYRSGYLDGQGRFHKGIPPTTPVRRSNVLFEQKKKLKSMDLFPEGGSGTLPLLCQLERRRPEETVEENGGVISSSIDLTLRL